MNSTLSLAPLLYGAILAFGCVAIGCGSAAEPRELEAPRTEPTPTATASLASAEREVTTPHGKLYVRTIGASKTAVVLLHGGPGASSHYLTSLDGLAGPQRMLVSYDQRGSWRSSHPANGDYSLAGHVEDLEAIRVSLGLEKIVVFGHSWGSILAMAYAAAHPERVAALVGFWGFPPTYADLIAASRRFSAHVEVLQRKGLISSAPAVTSGDDCTAGLAAVIPAYLSNPTWTPTPDLVETKVSCRAKAKTSAAMEKYDFGKSLRTLRVPVLSVYGADDAFEPERWEEGTKAAFASAELTFDRLPACGHLWHECPEAAAASIGGFLDGVVGPAN